MPRLRPRAILTTADLPIQGAANLPPEALNDPATPAAPAPSAGQTNYLGRLVAYIPAEVIAVYQAFAGPIGTPDEDAETANAVVGASDPAAGAIANPSALLWLGLILLALTPV